MHDDVVELARKLDLPDPSVRPLRCAIADCTAVEVKACAKCRFVCFCSRAHQLECVSHRCAALIGQGVAAAPDQLQVSRNLGPGPFPPLALTVRDAAAVYRSLQVRLVGVARDEKFAAQRVSSKHCGFCSPACRSVAVGPLSRLTSAPGARTQVAFDSSRCSCVSLCVRWRPRLRSTT